VRTLLLGGEAKDVGGAISVVTMKYLWLNMNLWTALQ